jgi:hypothetical protein
MQRGRAHSACACFQCSRRVLGSVSVDKVLDTAHHIGSFERAHGRKFDPGRMELLIRKNPGCECPRTVGVAITDKTVFSMRSPHWNSCEFAYFRRTRQLLIPFVS